MAARRVSVVTGLALGAAATVQPGLLFVAPSAETRATAAQARGVQLATAPTPPPAPGATFTAPSAAAVAAGGLALAGLAAAAGRRRGGGAAGRRPERRRAVAVRARGGEAADYDSLVADLKALVAEKNCGPILIRLSWHDAGVYSTGKLTGGCPNAVMRFTDAGEGTFGANAGLPDVAVGLLKPIADKYVPDLISNADLWVLAANIAIEIMGGPKIPTRFGRTDAKTSAESVESQVGRLPDGDKGVDHLRDIFAPKGFSDKDIVALSGAHTVGACHLDRSGFDGPWTEDPLRFDNTYFKEMVTKKYDAETTEKGCPQFRDTSTGTMMLTSDLALLEDPGFKVHVEKYAEDEAAYFADFKEAWVKLQENGCSGLKDSL